MKARIAPFLYIDDSPGKGRGVFTRKRIPPMKVIEKSSVLPMDENVRKLLDQTPLSNYIFEWGHDAKKCCVAWGYISLYNHNYNSNCEYSMDYDNHIMIITTIREIMAGEELTVNYNGDWNNEQSIWFDAQ